MEADHVMVGCGQGWVYGLFMNLLHLFPEADVPRSEADKVAPPQFAVDTKVEECKFAHSVLHLQSDPQRPNAPELEGRLPARPGLDVVHLVGGAFEHPEVAAAAGVHQALDRLALEGGVDQQRRGDLVPIPGVVVLVLWWPLIFALSTSSAITEAV